MSLIAQKLISASGPKEETDPDFNLVTQLYQFDGTNGAQNNTLLDSSPESHTVTRNADIVQGSFSPFSSEEGKWSASFDGTDDYLQIADSSDLEIASSEFTMECWFFQRADSGSGSSSHTLLSKWDNDGRKEFILRITENSSNQVLHWLSSSDGSSNDANFYGNTVITNNEWHHAAATRDSSNTIRLFLDGVLQSSTASQSSTYTGTHEFMIGANGTSGIQQYMDGFISNVRFIKGTALYTSSSYTVPTAPLTAVTNTKLLTCCSNRFKDKSTSAHRVAPNASGVNHMTSTILPKVQPFSPFAPSSAYDAASKGGSGFFDQTSDCYFDVSDATDFDFGTGDYSVEMWVYPTTTFNTNWAMAFNTIGVNQYWAWTDGGGNEAAAGLSSYPSGNYSGSYDHMPNRFSWSHVVFQNTSGTENWYINGVRVYNATNNPSFSASATGVRVGLSPAYASQFFYGGYISDVRVLKGSNAYSNASTLTVPTAPLGSVTNTKLLTNFTNAAMFDQTGKTNVDTVGNAQLNTSIKKFGSASAKFDESGDYLIVRNAPLLGGGDFTIEGFVYFNSSPTDGQGLFVYDSQSLGNRAGYGPALGTYAHAPYDGKWHSYYGTQATPGTGTQGNSEATPSATTWIHFAYVRTSGVIKIFIGGSQIGSDIAWTGNYIANDVLTIAGYYSTSYLLNGYIDSYRVTLNARYTSNFTPPSEEFPNR